MHENREISSAPSVIDEGRSVKAHSRTTDTHALEKSDCAVLPVNRPNKGRQLPAEAGEGRAQMKENIDQPHMLPTQRGKGVSQGLDGVRKAARERSSDVCSSDPAIPPGRPAAAPPGAETCRPSPGPALPAERRPSARRRAAAPGSGSGQGAGIARLMKLSCRQAVAGRGAGN